MKRLLSAMLATVAMAFAMVAKDVPSGAWSGKLNVGGSKLNLVFNFAPDGSCTLDSPDQGAKGITATVGVLTADSVNVSIPAIGGSYSGRVEAESIVGTFSQSGYSFPLTLTPGGVVLNRPQTPKPPHPYTTEEVAFANPSDGAVLKGTLTYPLLYALDGNATPVVLLVSGSGLQNRDEELFGHKPFAVIADYLAMRGIASLRYDDRGFGKSTGDTSAATTATFAGDAAAGVAYLRKTGKFGKVGVVGHSEGGTIAFILGADKKADFIVSLAGGALPGDSILLQQNKSFLVLGGVSPMAADDYCKALGRIFSLLASGKKQIDVDALLSAENITLPEELVQNLKEIEPSMTPWLAYYLSLDPRKDIAKAGCPVFALNGSKDLQVNAKSNLSAIKNTLPANEKNRIEEYPGLNHLFQHCTTGSIAEYGSIEETFSTDALRDIADWIKSL